jgi:hypothetical protein
MEIKTFVLGSGSNFGYFTTVDADGAPITLAGTPSLACNINGGAAATAGLTLAVDSGSVTGRHRIEVDVDDGTLALADGDSVDVYVAAGTVDGASVVGQTVLKFVATDGSLLAQTEADINAQVDLAISDAALATAAALATVDGEVETLQTSATDIQSRLPAALNNGAIVADIQRVNDVALVGDGSATPFNV